MKKFVGLTAKIYSYLKDNNDKDNKGKGTKKCVIKINLKFRDYKKCLKACQIENKMKIKKSIQKRKKLMQIVLKKIKRIRKK